MSFLKEYVNNKKASKNKSGITWKRLDENTVSIGITKYMDAAAKTYIKQISADAKEDWERLDPSEQESAGSFDEFRDDLILEEFGMNVIIRKFEKAFKQAVKRNLK